MSTTLNLSETVNLLTGYDFHSDRIIAAIKGALALCSARLDNTDTIAITGTIGTDADITPLNHKNAVCMVAAGILRMGRTDAKSRMVDSRGPGELYSTLITPEIESMLVVGDKESSGLVHTINIRPTTGWEV